MKINIIDEFGKKTFYGTKRMQVLSQPIRFRNLGDMFLIHYFKINSFFFFKKVNSANYTLLLHKIHLIMTFFFKFTLNDLLQMRQN